jgi:hypothetical protein
MRKFVAPAAVSLACLLCAPAGAVVTIGPPHPNPDPGGSQAINWAQLPSLLFNHLAPPGIRLTAPTAGVVTHWRVYTDSVSAGNTFRLRTMTPAGGTSYVLQGGGPAEDVPVTPTNLNNNLHSFASRIPIQAGQNVGLEMNRTGPGFVEPVLPAFAFPGWRYGFYTPAVTPVPPDGVPTNAGIVNQPPENSQMVALNADVEPDADGDQFGDDSQDRCLDQAGTDRGCPPGTLDPQTVTVVQTTTLLPPNASAEIDGDSVKLSKNRKRLSVRISCPEQQAASCAGTVQAKTKRRGRSLSLGSAKFSVGQGTSKTIRLRVPAKTRRALRKVKRIAVVLTVTGPSVRKTL